MYNGIIANISDWRQTAVFCIMCKNIQNNSNLIMYNRDVKMHSNIFKKVQVVFYILNVQNYSN